MRIRLRRALLPSLAALAATTPLLLVHDVRASVPPGGLTIQLDDPTPGLAYDTSGMLDFGAVSPAVQPAASLPTTVAGAKDGRSLDCLSTAIYYEARSEPAEGQRAVAQVVLNRVGRPGFPGSVCGVVYQGLRNGRGCQFNFACDGSLAARRERGAWIVARRIARAVIDGDILASLRGVTFFHSRAVTPGWTNRMVRVATIGSHIFYRSGRA